jgi:hypothetical protein
MSSGPFRRWSLAPVRWVGRAIRDDGIEREALVRAAKTAGAVSLAWLVAGWVLRMPQSFAAPYAAVFVMRETVYRSVASAVQQFFGLLTGLLLAYLAISVVYEPVAALGVAVFVSVLVGRWRRWGANGEWVAITALVMLTYGIAGEGGVPPGRAVSGGGMHDNEQLTALPREIAAGVTLLERRTDGPAALTERSHSPSS